MQKSTRSFSASFQALSLLNSCSSIRARDWLVMQEGSIGSGGRPGGSLQRPLLTSTAAFNCATPPALSSKKKKSALTSPKLSWELPRAGGLWRERSPLVAAQLSPGFQLRHLSFLGGLLGCTFCSPRCPGCWDLGGV